MLIDAPSTEDISDEIELTEKNADEVLKLLKLDG